MTELNITFLSSFILSGYKFMLCIPKENHVLLHPLKKEIPAIIVKTMQGCLLAITEKQVRTMATGIPDFRFLITEDVFNAE